MSFVTTQPEALAYAAGKLQTLGSAMADESAAAAAPTTGVVPAAADEVSALQATIFAAVAPAVPAAKVATAAIARVMSMLFTPLGRIFDLLGYLWFLLAMAPTFERCGASEWLTPREITVCPPRKVTACRRNDSFTTSGK
jgi:hypothetical protein